MACFRLDAERRWLFFICWGLLLLVGEAFRMEQPLP